MTLRSLRLQRLPLLGTLAFLAAPLSAQVIDCSKISQTQGGFGGTLGDLSRFGVAMTSLADLDGDGTPELLVGADWANGTQGEAWILFLDASRQVKSELRIFPGSNGFVGPLQPDDLFGAAVANLGDLNGDGSEDIAIGAHGSDVLGPDQGQVWILFLDPNPSNPGRVIGEIALGRGVNGCPNWSQPSGNFGHGLAGLGDFDGDGVPDLAVATDFGLSQSSAEGQVWILRLNPNGTVKSHSLITEGVGGLNAGLQPGDRFGADIECLRDLDGDSVTDIAVGAINVSGAQAWAGAVFVLFLNPTGDVKSFVKINEGSGGFSGPLQWNGQFGEGLAWLSNSSQLVVGAYGADTSAGSTWVLDVEPTGMVSDAVEIREGREGLCVGLAPDDWFGHGAAPLGDLNGDGYEEVAVGAMGDDDGGNGRGAVYLLSLAGQQAIYTYCYCDATLAPCGNADAGAGCANSTGMGTRLDPSGSASVALDDLVLSATQAPANVAGIFFMGGGQACPLPFGDGLLCVNPGPSAFCRYSVQGSGPSGTFVLGPGIVARSQSFSSQCRISSGASWRFQAWHRDPMGPCGAKYNLSNAVSVTFQP